MSKKRIKPNWMDHKNTACRHPYFLRMVRTLRRIKSWGRTAPPPHPHPSGPFYPTLLEQRSLHSTKMPSSENKTMHSSPLRSGLWMSETGFNFKKRTFYDFNLVSFRSEHWHQKEERRMNIILTIKNNIFKKLFFLQRPLFSRQFDK